jgi:hypothetical protein
MATNHVDPIDHHCLHVLRLFGTMPSCRFGSSTKWSSTTSSITHDTKEMNEGARFGLHLRSHFGLLSAVELLGCNTKDVSRRRLSCQPARPAYENWLRGLLRRPSYLLWALAVKPATPDGL